MLTYSHFMWDYEPMMYGWREGQHAEAEAAGRREGGLGDRLGDRRRRQRHPPDAEAGRDRAARRSPTTRSPAGSSTSRSRDRGTALIAAEETGRTCYAIEQSPAFCDVAVARWEAFTGKQAREGGPWASIAAAEVNRRVADIYALVVDGLPLAAVSRFVAASCSWNACDRTLCRYIARARELMMEQAKQGSQEAFAESLARKQLLYSRAVAGKQWKTALAIQNSIDRCSATSRACTTTATTSGASSMRLEGAVGELRRYASRRQRRRPRRPLCRHFLRRRGVLDLCAARILHLQGRSWTICGIISTCREE